MSHLNLSGDSIVSLLEFERFKKFLDDEGFRRLFLNDAKGFGLVGDSVFPNNFEVNASSGGARSVTLKKGMALDKKGRMIRNLTGRHVIDFPNIEGKWHWLKIFYSELLTEEGTVDIDNVGNLTGHGTRFTEYLRGNVNVTRVSFPGSLINVGEYDVAEVIDDETAILAGSFFGENGSKLSVVGAFTLDSIPDKKEKNIYRQDGFGFEWASVPDGPGEPEPPLKDGQEFFLARCRWIHGAMEIEDMRGGYVYRSKADFLATYLDRRENRCIGVEAVKWDSEYTPRTQNTVIVAWGFRTTSWTFNANDRRIHVSGGHGGRMKSSDQFEDGDFDGWRAYFENGSYALINQSLKSGRGFDLLLGHADARNFAGDNLRIMPDAEEVILEFLETGADVAGKSLSFPVNQPFARVAITVHGHGKAVYLRYRYRNNNHYTRLSAPFLDTKGYYSEISFDEDGHLKNAGRATSQPNEPGEVRLAMHPDAYRNVIDRLTVGDVHGLTIRELDNENPQINIRPGEDTRDQLFDHSKENPIVLSLNHYINILKTAENGDDLADGAVIFLSFKGNINVNDNRLFIVDGYATPGNTGNVLLEIKQDKLDLLAQNEGTMLRARLMFSKDKNGFYVYQYGELSDLSLNSPAGAAGGGLTGEYPNPGIGDLDAGKITTGVLALARVPSIPGELITSGTVNPARIAGLDASKLISGTVSPARIGGVYAAKLRGVFYQGDANLIATHARAGLITGGEKEGLHGLLDRGESTLALKGVWNPENGYPVQHDPIQKGDVWVAEQNGVIQNTSDLSFFKGDIIIALVNDPNTSTFQREKDWLKIDTDSLRTPRMKTEGLSDVRTKVYTIDYQTTTIRALAAGGQLFSIPNRSSYNILSVSVVLFSQQKGPLFLPFLPFRQEPDSGSYWEYTTRESGTEYLRIKSNYALTHVTESDQPIGHITYTYYA